MKKIWMIFCFSLLFCSTVFFGCENKENQNEEIVLRIANWEEYLDEGGWDEDETIDLDEKTKILGRENMVDDFESWYEKTYGEKVRVEYSTFGTNEDLYNQMTLGDTFDLVCPSEYMIMKLSDYNIFVPFHKGHTILYNSISGYYALIKPDSFTLIQRHQNDIVGLRQAYIILS